MAVAPKDLLNLTPEDQEAVGKLEKILDEKLTANYEPGGQCRLNLTNAADAAKVKLSFKMKKELEARYEKVGWMVGFEANGATEFIVLAEAPKEGTPAPKPPVVNVGPPQVVPVSAPGESLAPEDILAEITGKPRAPQAPQASGGVRPPVINKMTRDDPENPYGRSRLSSRD